MSLANAEALLTSINYVVETSVSSDAISSTFPPHWLFHKRWNKKAAKGAVMPDGNSISFITVGGRTSAFVERVQGRALTGGGKVSQIKKCKEGKDSSKSQLDITTKV